MHLIGLSADATHTVNQIYSKLCRENRGRIVSKISVCCIVCMQKLLKNHPKRHANVFC